MQDCFRSSSREDISREIDLDCFIARLLIVSLKRKTLNGENLAAENGPQTADFAVPEEGRDVGGNRETANIKKSCLGTSEFMRR